MLFNSKVVKNKFLCLQSYIFLDVKYVKDNFWSEFRSEVLILLELAISI